MAQRSSRKRRKERRRAAGQVAGGPADATQTTGGSTGEDGRNGEGTADATRARSGADAMRRGYARGRAKDDAARAALVPLEPGERPTAVTVGAIVAVVAIVGNLVALAFNYDPDESRQTTSTIVGAVVLAIIAVGMWRARYWAVLGMQTLLAITIIIASLALMTAVNALAVAIVVVTIAAAGTLFWFLVKAMARIQMPERPDAGR